MRWILYAATVALIVVHQDYWNWSKVEPKWFGFLPVGLWYHALFCVAAAVLLWLFVAFCWPTHLESAETDVPGQTDTH